MKIKIDFTDNQNKLGTGLKMRLLIRRAIYGTLKFEHFYRNARVSVTFTDNEGIKEKNREFRGIDRPTDVLSFPMYDFSAGEKPEDGEDVELGDIVLSLEKAAAQAYLYGHSYERECAFLTVHSMLHLLGYDHVNSDEEDRIMRCKQRHIMEGIGLGVTKEEKR